jgi:thioredoxin-related protein
MLRQFIFGISAYVLTMVPAWASDYELVMVKRDGCVYCDIWERDLGPIYPKTDVGAFAPLRKVDISETKGPDTPFKTPVVFTPTFVIMENGREMRRMEGYQSEDFFWGVLEMILERETDFVPASKLEDKS